jgi:hypothetical protein
VGSIYLATLLQAGSDPEPLGEEVADWTIQVEAEETAQTGPGITPVSEGRSIADGFLWEKGTAAPGLVALSLLASIILYFRIVC